MDNTERNAPRLSVGWQYGTAEPGDPSFEHGAAFAGVLARMLAAAGYRPVRLDVGLQRGAQGGIELHVIGDVPGMPQADFESLARVTSHALRLRRDIAAADDLVVVARLDESGADVRAVVPAVAAPRVSVTPVAAPPPVSVAPALPSAAPRQRRLVTAATRALESLPLTRLAIGVAMGLFLGVVGLPRLDFSLPSGPQTAALAQVTPVIPPATSPDNAPPTLAPTATPIPPVPTPTPVTILSAASTSSNVLFAERFMAPLANWPNDPYGTAWFADGALHLFPRESGRFVAVGVPRIGSVGDGMFSAQFRKVEGPEGGGYGIIIRDQTGSPERDSRSQAGQYLVVEVGDRGDIGIWHREQTRWVDVVPWTHSDAVRPGDEPNTLVVHTVGNSIRFEVNGELVAAVNYAGLPPTGGVGVFVGGDLNEVALEWLRVETS